MINLRWPIYCYIFYSFERFCLKIVRYVWCRISMIKHAVESCYQSNGQNSTIICLLIYDLSHQMISVKSESRKPQHNRTEIFRRMERNSREIVVLFLSHGSRCLMFHEKIYPLPHSGLHWIGSLSWNAFEIISSWRQCGESLDIQANYICHTLLSKIPWGRNGVMWSKAVMNPVWWS